MVEPKLLQLSFIPDIIEEIIEIAFGEGIKHDIRVTLGYRMALLVMRFQNWPQWKQSCVRWRRQFIRPSQWC